MIPSAPTPDGATPETTLTEVLQVLAGATSSGIAAGEQDSFRRSVIAAGPAGGIQLGKTIINISASSNIKIGERTLDSPSATILTQAVQDAYTSISANLFERSLRDYFGAIREFSNSFGYDLRYIFSENDSGKTEQSQAASLSNVYVPLRYVSLSERKRFALPPTGTLDIRDVLRSISIDEPPRLLFEGAAGSGKSTLLRQIIRYCWDDPDQLSLRTRFLPVYSRLASLAQSPGGSIEERLWSSIAADNLVSLNSPPPTGWFTEWPRIMQSPVLLLLDGFDEVGPEKQIELRGWIDRLLRQGHAIVLTSRSVSSVGVVLADRFLCCRVAPFSFQQQQELAHNWLGRRSTSFLSEVRKTQSSIVSTTPLLLTIAAFVYASNTKLPKGRAALYERFLTAWLGESRRRGLHQELGAPSDYLRESLGFLALEMTEHPSDCAENCLASCLTRFYKEFLGRPVLEASRWARQFIEISTKRSAILNSSAGKCTWIHPTFREYLAAETLANATLSDDKLLAYVDRWNEEPWHEVILFLFGILSERHDITRLVNHIAAKGTLEALLFVSASIADGAGVHSGFKSVVLGHLSSLVIEEIQERSKEEKFRGAKTLRLASQTALRLLSHSGLGATGDIKNLGAYVGKLAAENRRAGDGAVQTLSELGCFEELAQLVSNITVAPEVRVEAAISLLRANQNELVLPHVFGMLGQDLGQKSSSLLPLLGPHVSSDRIVELIVGSALHGIASAHFLLILGQRQEFARLRQIVDSESVDLLTRVEASLIVDEIESTSGPNTAFARLLQSVSDLSDGAVDWDQLVSWLVRRHYWSPLAQVALLPRCPELKRFQAVKELAAAEHGDFVYQVFEASRDPEVKLEAAMSVFTLKGNADALAHIEEWCSRLDVVSHPELAQKWAGFLLNKGRYNDALPLYTNLISQTGGTNLLFANRANCYRLLNRNEDAIVEFTNAIVHDDSDSWSLVRRGHCFWRTDRDADALKDFRQAEQIGFAEPEFYLYYGSSCWCEHDSVGAVKFLNKFIEFDPDDWRGYYYRGLTFLDGELRRRAVRDFRRAIELNNTSIDATNCLADCYTLEKKIGQAYSVLKNTLDLKPDSTSLRIRLTKAALCKGDLANAEDSVQILLRMEPNEPVYKYLEVLCASVRNRCRVAIKEGTLRIIQATREARNARDSMDSYISTLDGNLAVYHAAMGSTDDAWKIIEDLQRTKKFQGSIRRTVLTALTELTIIFPQSTEIDSCLRRLVEQTSLEVALEQVPQRFPKRSSSTAARSDGQRTVTVIPKSSDGIYPFPCYCRLSGINGLDALTDFTKAMVAQLETSIPAVALITLDGPERVMGHCNFKQEVGDDYNLKFCDTYRTFIDSDLKKFVAGVGPFCLLLAESDLLERLQTEEIDIKFGISLRFVTVNPDNL